jgi:hypothetical protein
MSPPLSQPGVTQILEATWQVTLFAHFLLLSFPRRAGIHVSFLRDLNVSPIKPGTASVVKKSL